MAASTQKVYVVRHGETEWNRARRYQGWSDSLLTARGIAQAEAIGRRLCALSEAAVPAAETSFDRGPALTEKDFQRRHRKFIPGTMFQGVQPIQ